MAITCFRSGSRAHGDRRIILPTTAELELMQVRQSREIVTGWAHANRQHDIGEFKGYLFTRINPGLLQGRWQARCLASAGGAARCLDQGHGAQTLTLSIPSRPPGLSHVVA